MVLLPCTLNAWEKSKHTDQQSQTQPNSDLHAETKHGMKPHTIRQQREHTIAIHAEPQMVRMII